MGDLGARPERETRAGNQSGRPRETTAQAAVFFLGADPWDYYGKAGIHQWPWGCVVRACEGTPVLRPTREALEGKRRAGAKGPGAK